MASVSGVITIGEADAARREIARRQARFSGLGELPLLLAFVVVFGAVGAVLLRGPGMAISVVIAFLAYWAIAMRLSVADSRKRAIELGMPAQMQLDFTTTAEGFSYRADGIEYIAKWPTVTELATVQGYWVFLIYLSPIFVPRRLFSDQNAERSFVEGVLQNVSEEARRRSLAARAFAGMP